MLKKKNTNLFSSDKRAIYQTKIKSSSIFYNKLYFSILNNILLIKDKEKELNKKFYTNFINPKITVIIPIYNCQNSIKQVLRSIQNQKMIEIKIIIINDQSIDNSLKIIENLQKDDKRIKLINNKRNMGIL